jgi:hypothetical protein
MRDRVTRAILRWNMAAACALGSVALACGGSAARGSSARAASAGAGPETVRYRLLLRDNAVDPAQAHHCWASCQSRLTPETYIECLSDCPGFELTENAQCAPTEVPPVAACFTGRPTLPASEPQPGAVVLGVFGGLEFTVGLVSVCASQTTQCTYAGGGVVP